MFDGKKILALITARGGSKGIPGKNIKPLAGKPLVGWTIDAARGSRYVDRTIISSDSEEIIKVAAEFGCEAPFVRPAELARDETPSMDVVMHALDAIGECYDYILLLQPTSPFRSSIDIDSAIELAFARSAKILVSVARLKKHPMFMFEISDGCLVPLIENKSGVQLRRQDMSPVFEHNGAIYFAEVEALRASKSFNVQGVVPFVMEGVANLDIDTPDDWDYAEFLVSKQV